MMNHSDDPRLHGDLLGEPFLPGAPDPYRQMNYSPYYRAPRKRKWLSALFSFFMPGTGHFYLGLMQRGLFIMALLIVDIFTIVTLVTRDHEASVPMVTLFALILPVIYFYNIFDALQSTDAVNRFYELGDSAGDPIAAVRDPLQKLLRGSNLGVLLIAAGCLFFLLSSKPRWFEELFNLLGSYIGSIVLIAAGLALFITEARKR